VLLPALTAPPPAAPRRWSWLPEHRGQWLTNPGKDLLSGLVVALALIPEALAFSVIAGVDPQVGLYAAMIIAIVTAVVGGRPGMISGATGSVALVVTPLVAQYGVDHLFAATILAGVFQVVLGALGVGALMRFVPRTVMLGFVNALGILLFVAQLPEVFGHGWLVYVLVAAALAIIYLLPRVLTAVPAPLVAIVVLTAVVHFTHAHVPDVGERGQLPTSLPGLSLPSVPVSWHTLGVIAPYALTMALVGLMESLMTAQLIDGITDTRSDKDVESRGQGIANIITGFLGGMAGCALIGQSMINMRNGGRTRLSTLSSGVFLLVLVLALAPVVRIIPMAALAAIMVVVSVGTFNWASIRPQAWVKRPRSETAVMVVTVVIVVVTGNLAIGVIVGVVLSALFFARRVAHLVDVTSTLDAAAGPAGATRTYVVTGALFFASSSELASDFDFDDPTPHVVIDLSESHIWDTTAIAALDAVVAKFAERGVHATVTGMNEHSALMHAELSGRLAPSS
jgi:sulfate permease, SulP family